MPVLCYLYVCLPVLGAAGLMKKGRVFMAPLNSCFRACMYSASSPVARGTGLCSIGCNPKKRGSIRHRIMVSTHSIIIADDYHTGIHHGYKHKVKPVHVLVKDQSTYWEQTHLRTGNRPIYVLGTDPSTYWE